MRRILGWSLMGLVAIWVGLGPAAAQSAAQSAAAPYIQYLDASTATYIIERTDGTDSRSFGPLTTPATATSTVRSVTGPGWSPSGEWFAVIGSFDAAGGGTITSADIINVDGSTRRSALAAFNVIEMDWTTGDLLLALVNTPATTDLVLVVVNANLDSVIAQRIIAPDATGGDYEAFWAGGLAVARFRNATGATTLTTLNPNTGAPNQVALTNVLGVSSSTGGYVYTVNASAAYGTLSGNVVEHTQPLTLVDAVAFHPTQDIALLSSLDGVWLVSPSELTLVVPSGRLNAPNQNGGQVTGPSRVWSPDGQSALVFVAGRANRFDLASRQYEPTALNSSMANSTIGWAPAGLIGVRSTAIDATPRLLVELDTPRFAGSFETRNMTSLAPAFSPNATYLAQVDMGVTVFNFSNNSRVSMGPDSRTFAVRNRSGRVVWGADSFHFLTFQDDGAGTSYPSVYDIIADPSRELPPCATASSLCALWLPSSVNVARLPIGANRSVLQPAVINRGWWSVYLAWSPDGSQLAVGGAPQNPASPLSSTADIYTVVAGQPVRSLIGRYTQFNPYTQEILWDANGVAYVADRSTSLQVLPAVLATSADGAVIARYAATGLALQNAADQSVIAELGAFVAPNEPRTVSFSPDGRFFAYGNQIVEVATGNVLVTLPHGATAVAFSPDGRLAATVGWDVVIYNTADLGL